jgi:hypothetical protein
VKRLLVSAAILITAATPLPAVTFWSETGARIDETVATSETKAPFNPLQPLLTDVPFSGFRYPHVDANEDITFIADDPIDSSKRGKHHGIYRSIAATGELRALVREGEAIPGSDIRFRWIRGLQVDGADLVFNATDSKGGRGFYHWSNGVLTTIARSRDTTVPGFDRPVTDVEWGALDHGRVFYEAHVDLEDLLALYDLKTKQTRLLCRTGANIPGQTDQPFRYFSHQNWIDHANVLFRGASVRNPQKPAPDGLGHHGLYGWLDVDWSQPDRAFDMARLITIADGRTPVPGLDKDARFHEFFSAPVRDDLTAFVAEGKSNDGDSSRREVFKGIYYCNITDPAKTIHSIVDTESRMGGLFRETFNYFAIFPSVFEKSVAFVGYADDDYVGVFLYRTDSDELFLLCDNRAALAGKHVTDFEIAGHFLVRNRFAVTAHFNDNTSGVYMATIPARSFKRIVNGGK